MTRFSGLGRFGQHAAKAVVALSGVVMIAAAPVHAQKAPAKKAAKKAANYWVKLCETVNIPKNKKVEPGKKVEFDKRKMCVTQSERVNGQTGQVIVAVGLRQLEGKKGYDLNVTLPLGVALPTGVRFTVLNKEQWERATNKKKPVTEKELKPVKMNFLFCSISGCTAEAPATPEIIKSMESGGGIVVFAKSLRGRIVPSEVPLNGFPLTFKGKATDSKLYNAQRLKMMQQIRARLREQIAARRAAGKVPNPKKVKKN